MLWQIVPTRRTIAETGVGVFSVYAVEAYEPDAGGTNRQVAFDLVERAVGRWAYVYEPGHVRQAEDPAHGYAEINDDWFFMAWDPSEQ